MYGPDEAVLRWMARALVLLIGGFCFAVSRIF